MLDLFSYPKGPRFDSPPRWKKFYPNGAGLDSAGGETYTCALDA